MVQIYSGSGAPAPLIGRFRVQAKPVAAWRCSIVMVPQYVTPVEDVVRYRLRRGERIVGWMREEASGQWLYSREGMWWSGRKIQWDQRDRCCGLRDLDDRWLHEGDIIRPAQGNWWRRRQDWLILCDLKHGWSAVRFGLFGTSRMIAQDALSDTRWRWAGFGWNRPV